MNATTRELHKETGLATRHCQHLFSYDDPEDSRLIRNLHKVFLIETTTPPSLNVVSGREELLKEQYDKTLQEQLKARDKEIEDIKHQQAVILDAIANGARVEPRLLRLQDTGIP